MVFQKPCVFPNSIRENVLFGLQFNRTLSVQQRQVIMEEKQKAVGLWDEVVQRLDSPAKELSLGQQQRLCIARTLVVDPQVLLLDEPTSSLDPVSNRAIEDLMLQLKDCYTIIFVTHNILQAKRIADHLIFMCDGKVIEQGDKEQLFNNPDKKQTWDYLNNEYCYC
jgi:phosphate transport system ATP-binding protein